MTETTLRVEAPTPAEQDVLFNWSTGGRGDDAVLSISYALMGEAPRAYTLNLFRDEVTLCVPYLTLLYWSTIKGYRLDTERPLIVRDSGKRELFRVFLDRDSLVFQSTTQKYRLAVSQLPFILEFFKVIAQNE